MGQKKASICHKEKVALILREDLCRSLASIASPEPRPLILPCDRLSICLNVAPTNPSPPCMPHTVRLSGHQTSARASRSSSLYRCTPPSWVNFWRTRRVSLLARTRWSWRCLSPRLLTLLCGRNCQALLSAFLSFLISITSPIVLIIL